MLPTISEEQVLDQLYTAAYEVLKTTISLNEQWNELEDYTKSCFDLGLRLEVGMSLALSIIEIL